MTDRNCSTCEHAAIPTYTGPCAFCVDTGTNGYVNWTPRVVQKDPAVPMVTVDTRTGEVWGRANGGIPLQAPAAPTVNPKEIAGSKKPPTWSVMPRWVTLLVGRVMSIGAAKYGAFNYRESRIAASTYQDAIERHAQLWFDGEDNDPETGVSHLASIISSCTLLLDAQASGKLDDDRQKTGLSRKALDELGEVMKTVPLPARQA